MEEDGFEPSKRDATDLQSAPFGHSGTPPYSILNRLSATQKVELVDGFEPPTCWLQISCSTSWATPARLRRLLIIPCVSLFVNPFFQIFYFSDFSEKSIWKGNTHRSTDRVPFWKIETAVMFTAVSVERTTRLELATSTLARWRSTRWATSACLARNVCYCTKGKTRCQ